MQIGAMTEVLERAIQNNTIQIVGALNEQKKAVDIAPGVYVEISKGKKEFVHRV